MKSGQPHKFKIDICFDEEEYPEGLHIHPKVVKADKIHLVPMFDVCHDNDTQLEMCYCFATFTWNELVVREIRSGGSLVKWKVGVTNLIPSKYFKFVAFVTV